MLWLATGANDQYMAGFGHLAFPSAGFVTNPGEALPVGAQLTLALTARATVVPWFARFDLGGVDLRSAMASGTNDATGWSATASLPAGLASGYTELHLNLSIQGPPPPTRLTLTFVAGGVVRGVTAWGAPDPIPVFG
ncbi:MAG TPA: hypothetical protein VGE77_02595 [Nocardioides sp.]